MVQMWKVKYETWDLMHGMMHERTGKKLCSGFNSSLEDAARS